MPIKLTQTPLTNIAIYYNDHLTPLTRSPKSDTPIRTYNECDDLVTVELPNGEWCLYVYDKHCLEISYEDHTGYWSETIRNSNGSIHRIHDSEGGYINYKYDSNGNFLSNEGLITPYKKMK